MQVVQLNLNHCEAAQLLLQQSVTEFSADVALLSDPYRVPTDNGSWMTDKSRSVAIWTCGRYPIQEMISSPADEGFVIAKVNGVYLCSCYCPPRWSTAQFSRVLDILAARLIGLKPLVVAGDFNAWAVDWGSRFTNARGEILLESLAVLNVVLLNDGQVPTFRGHSGDSCIDVTFCSAGWTVEPDWKVHEGYTSSDHQEIRFMIGYTPKRTTRRVGTADLGWRTSEFNPELFEEALRWESRTTNLSGEELTELLTRACDVTMPRRTKPPGNRQPVYWWSNTIADLRRTCLKAKRRMRRARTDAERVERRRVFQAASRALNYEIKCSKRACFEQLCRMANDTPWGDAYRIVMARTNSVPPEKSPEMLARIVEGLFPKHEPSNWPDTPYESVDVIPLVTNEELIVAARKLKLNKAPGPDGITNLVLKHAILANPDMFRTCLQRCMDEGNFPEHWKRQKLVLLPKPGKEPGDPSAYRPICLLDTAGKLLERVILNRLSAYTERAGGLSNNQYGFRKGRSTVEAIRAVTDTAKIARGLNRRGIRYCALITLDVKNAFNNASWKAIADSLHRLRVPDYLCRILKSYFQNRILVYDSEVGPQSIEVSAGVPQGSILGPVLWNIMYDGVLRISLPAGVRIEGFADDVMLEVAGDTLEEVQLKASYAIGRVEEWLNSRRLALAHHKTEVVVVHNRHGLQQARIRVGTCTVNSVRSLKHLGVMIDDKLNFTSHVDYACQRASLAIKSLSRMMSNRSAVHSQTRRLIAGVALSIIRYAVPAWAVALEAEYNVRKLVKVHRLMCLRVASAYRTISYEAVCVIAGMMPIDILLEEDVECYNERGLVNVRPVKRAASLLKWQSAWDTSAKGRWTHRLIPDVSKWVNRGHGQVNFHLSQVLSEHGCFKKFLHRFGFADTAECPECVGEVESAEHVMFACPRFEVERISMLLVSGMDTTPDNLVERMIRDVSVWNAVNTASTQVMSKLQRWWRLEQHQRQQ